MVQLAGTIGTLFEAGAGTTASVTMYSMLAMTLHPLEFKKLHQEVDNVAGPDRLPSFDNISTMPRVRAVAKETLEWRLITAGGIPHILTKGANYKMPDGRSLFMAVRTNVHPVQ